MKYKHISYWCNNRNNITISDFRNIYDNLVPPRSTLAGIIRIFKAYRNRAAGKYNQDFYDNVPKERREFWWNRYNADKRTMHSYSEDDYCCDMVCSDPSGGISFSKLRDLIIANDL